MFAADAHLHAVPRSAAAIDTDFHQFADAAAVNTDEGVLGPDLGVQIIRNEPRVVAGEPEGRLGQVVRAEGEELRFLRDFVGGQRGARQFDHRADLVVHVHAGFRLHGPRRPADDVGLQTQFVEVADQGNHDFRNGFDAAFHAVARRLEDRPGLHLGDLRIGDAQPAAPVAEHGVGFPQVLQFPLVTLHGHPGLRGELRNSLVIVGQKLVQRRVERSYGDGIAVHDLEYPDEVASLDRQQPGQRLPPAGLVVGQDHLADRVDPVFFEEHVLRPAKADALGPEGTRGSRLIGLVRIGPHPQPARPVRPGHQAFVPLVDFRFFGGHGFLQQDLEHLGRDGRDGPGDDFTGRPIDGYVVPFGDDVVADAHLPRGVVDVQLAAAGNADLAHLAGHQRGVARHAAPRGQDARRGVHAPYVFGRRFYPDQDDLVAPARPRLGIEGVEHHLARGRARTGVEAPREDAPLVLRPALFFHVEDRPQQLVELVGFHATQGFPLVDQPFLHHIHRDRDGGETGAFPYAALQHPKGAALDGEFDVLHILVMGFQRIADPDQLMVGVRHLVLQLLDRLGGSYPRHDVLALGVDQIFAVEPLLAGGGIAAESDPRGAVVAHVAVDHGLHVDGGAPFVRDIVQLPVHRCPFVVPRAEHGPDGSPELLAGIVGEVGARARLDLGLELGDQRLEVIGPELHVLRDAPVGLLAFQQRFEGIVIFIIAGSDAHDHVAIHLHETPVAVVGEAFVARLCDQSLNGHVVQTEIQNGVHHAGHGGPGSGTDGYEQWVVGIAETGVHDGLDLRHRPPYLVVQIRRITAFVAIIIGAYLRRDRKASGHGDLEVAHLRQVCPLAAQKLPHFHGSFRLAATKIIHMFRHNATVLLYSVQRDTAGRFFIKNQGDSITLRSRRVNRFVGPRRPALRHPVPRHRGRPGPARRAESCDRWQAGVIGIMRSMASRRYWNHAIDGRPALLESGDRWQAGVIRPGLSGADEKPRTAQAPPPRTR